LRALLLSLLALAVSAGAARADAIEDFYHGRQLRFIIGSNNGGGYDSYGRLLAAHLGRHIPGHPTIVAENMPGASGTKSATYLYEIAPKDGTVLGMFNQSMAQRQMLEPQLVPFDTSRFNWIGAMGSSVNIFITWHASGVATLEDAKTKPVVMGALSDDGGNAVYPLLINKFLGTRFKVVLGYQGGNTIQLAMERGEVDGRGSVVWSGFKANWSSWLEQGKAHVILQIGLAKDPDLPDVPLLLDLARDPTQAAIFRFISSDTIMNFPVIAPPDLPPERVAALRRAMTETLEDPVFLEDAQHRALPIRGSSGETVQKVVASMIATPPDVIRRLKQSLAEAKPESKAK
jgi:tripartite-type tricarboxylate transporter receptor subunit TctC